MIFISFITLLIIGYLVISIPLKTSPAPALSNPKKIRRYRRLTFWIFLCRQPSTFHLHHTNQPALAHNLPNRLKLKAFSTPSIHLYRLSQSTSISVSHSILRYPFYSRVATHDVNPRRG